MNPILLVIPDLTRNLHVNLFLMLVWLLYLHRLILSFFSPQKNETKKALKTASSPIAIGYLPYSRSFAKNG